MLSAKADGRKKCKERFRLRPKPPRPRGKATRYEYSQRACGPSDTSYRGFLTVCASGIIPGAFDCAKCVLEDNTSMRYNDDKQYSLHHYARQSHERSIQMESNTLEIIALIVSGAALLFSVITYRLGLRQGRRQATLDAYNNLQKEALDELYRIMPADIRAAAANRRSPEYKHIRTLVARIEHFSVGVTEKIYDRKTVYELAHGFLDGAIKLRVDALLETDHNHRTDYYKHIHELYAWMKKQSKHSRGKSHHHHSSHSDSSKPAAPAKSA